MSIERGARFNQYAIISPIGSGGMGEIYLAQDTKLGRRVALKLLPEKYTQDEERVRRFEQEARAASALNHPNIITIFEVGHVNETHFIATEFVEGEAINQMLARGPLSLSQTLDLAVQVAQALVAAHEAGIMHRDIKPENVMLRRDGYVKVLDFGLAKLIERFPSGDNFDPEATTKPLKDTSPGIILGTASYMSPEQARGLRVDARSDIFSLGIVLYEMVAGRRPFTGETMSDVLAAILNHDPEPLTPDVPRDLRRIIEHALAKPRELRYQSARELLNELKRLQRQLALKHEEIASQPTFFGEVNAADARRSDSPAGGRSGGANRPFRYDTDVIEQTRSMSSAEYLLSGIKRHKLRSGVVTALLLTALFGVWHFAFRVRPQFANSIAVLPFVRADNDPTTAALADGITGQLIQNLSRIPRLRVRSIIGLGLNPNGAINPRTVGQQLQVPVVIVGSVARRGETLALNVDLVDTRDGTRLWGYQANRKPSDLLVMQAEITKEVAQRLRLNLNKDEQARREAFELYLRGRYFWNRRTAADLQQGRELFEQAVKRAPKYAPAHAGLADSYNLLGAYGVLPPAAAFPKAKAAVEQALKLDDALAEAHAALGFYYLRFEQNWAAAEREFRRAIELDPNYASAHQWYSSLLISVGRIPEAIEEAKHCQELDPLSLIAGSHSAWIHYLARQYEQAIAQCQKILALDPNFFPAHRYAGLAYEQKRRYREATAELTQAIELSGGSAVITAALAHVHAVSGKRQEARRLLAASAQPISAYDSAVIHTGLGELEAAFASLERAFRERSEYLSYLRVDPRLDPLRADARFAALLQRLKFPPG